MDARGVVALDGDCRDCLKLHRLQARAFVAVDGDALLAGIPLSTDKVIDIAKTIITMRIRMPENGGCFTKTMFLTERHMSIMPLFDNRITQN